MFVSNVFIENDRFYSTFCQYLFGVIKAISFFFSFFLRITGHDRETTCFHVFDSTLPTKNLTTSVVNVCILLSLFFLSASSICSFNFHSVFHSAQRIINEFEIKLNVSNVLGTER